MIRAIIVDDELPAIDRLKKLLRSYPEIDIVSECQDGLTALKLIEEKKPDVVFLDIDMPELNGLEVAKTLGFAGPLIIFATAYDEYALQAFESNAVDYIVKPINPSRLELTVEKIRKAVKSGNRGGVEAAIASLQVRGAATRLAVKIGSKYEVFDPKAISVAIARDHYTTLVVDGRELLADDSLEAVSQRLDPDTFLRVHRSYILNVHFLKELKREGDRKYIACLSDKTQTQVPISRERLPQLKAFLGLD